MSFYEYNRVHCSACEQNFFISRPQNILPLINVIQQHADITMCFLWLVTYILVIISTIKSKFPAMSPIACIIIFPWELLVAIGSISAFNALSYVHVAHIGFAILDLLIILVIIFKLRYFDIHNTVCYIYILFVNILVTLLMWRLPNGVLYSSYINTFLGTVFWILYILRDCYPTTRINIFLVQNLLPTVLHLLHIIQVTCKFLS